MNGERALLLAFWVVITALLLAGAVGLIVLLTINQIGS
jgi:hypothetical protein